MHVSRRTNLDVFVAQLHRCALFVSSANLRDELDYRGIDSQMLFSNARPASEDRRLQLFHVKQFAPPAYVVISFSF